ncbi:MAG: endolytic transglycosylase MltG [Deltaproteobacteria bacterium]|nr:endolytic transglycosylase MltG [Deltaproteobacteria bacterium]MBW2399855.1 endolytic transglycosylase MltG [Deltaproteobacteria bacterium]MBW2665168.1 endolytic transglycosylase MltG [Deltaproteobacteria bacterium]
MKWLLVGFAALLLCGAIAAAAAWHQITQNLEPVAAGAEPVIFTVHPGETLKTVASRLESEGLVRNRRVVEWFGRYHELGNKLRTGEYWVSAAETPGEILATLTTGQVATYELAIPEGFTAAMIARRIEVAKLGNAEEFLAWVHDPKSAEVHGVEGATLEGYLFPETYRLPKGLGTRETAGVLVSQFLTVWKELEPRAREQKISMKDLVTLASIIEKETGVAEERPLIAAVFLNRMRRGMRLETDPTVIYGIPNFDGNLRRRDLENPDNPYNTYKIPGLPPGPIANPGRGALEAVLAPATVDSLFFVSKNDGTHVFSDTYAEHERRVDEYQRRRRKQ